MPESDGRHADDPENGPEPASDPVSPPADPAETPERESVDPALEDTVEADEEPGTVAEPVSLSADSTETPESVSADRASTDSAEPDEVSVGDGSAETPEPVSADRASTGGSDPGEVPVGDGSAETSESVSADPPPRDTGEPEPETEPDEPEEPSGRRLRRVTAGVVALLLVGAVAAFAFDLGPRWFGWDYPSPLTQPAEVAPPPGLELPVARVAAPVADAVPDQGADPAAVTRALRALVKDKKLGPHAAVRVAELRGPDAGKVVFSSGPDEVTPASTLKLLTSTAVLSALGPDHRFSTRVVVGAQPGVVTLVGGGDPLLARRPDIDGAYPHHADLQTLAAQTAKALAQKGRHAVHLRYDAGLFAGPAVSPSWEQGYVPDVVSPISALWVDEGRGEGLHPDPARFAATVFAKALHRHGVTVVGAPLAAPTPPGATTLADVQSAPLSQVVQYVLEASDNAGAEVLARHSAIATRRPATFTGGAAAVRARLQRLGVDLTGLTTYDGSGLSRKDRLRPETLLEVLETAASPQHPQLRTVVTGLPVSGFTGSLALRFQNAPAAGLGVVRAKTGTLTGVHGLAGTVLTKDGTLLAFVGVADRVKLANTLAARDDLDKIAAALAGCTCAATP